MPEPVFFQHFQVDQKPDGGLRELGRGAMGITYKAFDTNLQCPVALKIINATLTDNEHARERFLREARAAARLRHPNVATVLHLGKDDHSFFYAMEFIEGETLEAYVARQGPLPPVFALEIVQQVARALGAAQNEGLVHRDIKPPNLMLVRHRGEAEDEGVHVKVIDFGLAKFVDKNKVDSLNLTMGGGFVGSPYFASPEQVEESEIDTRSDIYSLGATLWFLLAGEPPFTGSLGQVLAQHLQRPPPYEKLEAMGIPAPVLALLRRLLAKAPEDRPSDPAALRREVSACLRSLGAVPGSSSGSVSPGEGLLAGKYLVLGSRGESETGQFFQARDRRSGQSVSVLKITPGLLGDPAIAAEVECAAELHRKSPVPGLVAVHALDRTPEGDYLVTEPIGGFSMVEVLRVRGRLEAAEVFDLLHRAAAILDAAGAAGAGRIPVSLRTVHAHFPDGLPGEQARRAVLESRVGEWPPFELWIEPVELRGFARSATGPDANAVTQLPGRASSSGSSGYEESPRAASLRALAETAYELLGGTLPPPNSLASYPPLTSLSEFSNEVLRGILNIVPADAQYQTARSFAEAMSKGASRFPSLPAGYASWQAVTAADRAGAFDRPARSSAAGSTAGRPDQAAGSSVAGSTTGGKLDKLAGSSAGSSPGSRHGVAPPPLPPVQPGISPPPPPIPRPARGAFTTAGKSCLVLIALVAAMLAILFLGSLALYLSNPKKFEHEATPTATPEETPEETPETPEARTDTPGPAGMPSLDEETSAPTPTPGRTGVPPPAFQTPAPQVRQLPTLPNGVHAIASYRTRLSVRDHRSSTGTRLTTVSDVLRQDRANFYRSRDHDDGDESDPLFADPKQRAQRFDGVPFYGNSQNVILNGTPYVQVDIYPGGYRVTVLSP